jgi:N-acetylneuraminic acid mutarotase
MKNFKNFLIIFTLNLFNPFITLSQTWQSGASLPEAMQPAVVKTGNKIFAVKNALYNSEQPSFMYEYDVAGNTWTRRGQMSVLRTGFALIEADGRIFAIGGLVQHDSATTALVEEYVISAGNWERKQDLPSSCADMEVLTHENKIYVVGGRKKIIENKVVKNVSCKSLFVYDIAKNSWEIKSDMQKCRTYLSAVNINDRIYAIGGFNYNSFSGENNLEEYNISCDTWTEKLSFMNGSNGLNQAVEINKKIYITLIDSKAHIAEYDPALDTWTERTELLSPVMDFAKIVIKNQLYIIGGHLVSGMNYSNKVIRYNPADNTQIYLPENSHQWCGITEIEDVIYILGGNITRGDGPLPPPTSLMVKINTNPLEDGHSLSIY